MAKWASDKRQTKDPLGADVHANLPPARPIDLIFGGRRQAIASAKCVPAPIGCGGEATDFRDEVSRKEYSISGLCQACQDTVFKPHD